MILYNEDNNLIDHTKWEDAEWRLANKFVKPNHVVLELGARYGTTSIIVDNILSNKKNNVCVEPDPSVWDVLEKNKMANNCEFNIIKGAISKSNLKFIYNHYASITVEGEGVRTYDLWDIERTFNLKFNVLIADCEGCLSVFINNYQEFFDQLELIIFETDNTEMCDYGKLTEILMQKKFVHVVSGFHNVFCK